MQNITIGRFESDPEAQGVIRPGDDSWQLVIDKEGYPHLFVRVKIEQEGEEPTTGMFLLEHLLPDKLTVKSIMSEGSFGGALAPEEEEEAWQEYLQDKEERGLPCPRQ